MKIKISQLLISAILAWICFLFSCKDLVGLPKESKFDTLSQIEKKGILRVGYVVFPPTVVKDPITGRLSGHFIDTIEYIANELNVKVQYHEATWATFISGLQAGQYDVAVAATFKTILRSKSVAFTRPLFYLGNSVLVKVNDTRFSTLSDLNQKGIKIAVSQGTGEHHFAERHLTNVDLIVLPSADLTLPLQEVVVGRADASISDTYTITKFLETRQGVKGLFVDKPFNLTAVAWAVRPDDIEWLNFLNAGLEYLEMSGRLKEFEAKSGANWFHLKYLWE